MARIRTVKPEFWADEKLAPLPPIDRLVFLGLISQADDDGRLVDNTRMLDGLLFPGTDDTCGPSLDTLARLGRVLRYRSASGQRLIQVARWTAHQKVDNHAKYTLPAPSAEDLGALEVVEPSPDPREDDARITLGPRVPIPYPRPTTNDQEQPGGCATGAPLNVENSDEGDEGDEGGEPKQPVPATRASPAPPSPPDEPEQPDAAHLNRLRGEAIALAVSTWRDCKAPPEWRRWSKPPRPWTRDREGSNWNDLVKWDPPEDVNAAARAWIRKNPGRPFSFAFFHSKRAGAQELFRQMLQEATEAALDGLVPIGGGRAL